jgi:hypothetical protein
MSRDLEREDEPNPQFEKMMKQSKKKLDKMRVQTKKIMKSPKKTMIKSPKKMTTLSPKKTVARKLSMYFD